MTISPLRTLLPADGRAVVPFELVRRLPTVDVVVPSGRRRPFILDTGSAMTVLRVGAGGLPATRPYSASLTAYGGGDGVPASLYREFDVTIGTARFEQFGVAAVDMAPAVTRGSRRPFAGVLGSSLFASSLVTVDYEAGQLVLERGELPPADGKEVLSLRSTGQGQFELPATLDGHQVWLLLDTCWGAPENVFVDGGLGDQLHWAAPPSAASTTYIDGEYPEKSGWVRGDLHVGRYVIHNPAVAQSAGKVDALSAATLRHFRVTLDGRNKRLRLAGPTDAPAGCDRLAGEGDWDESTEQVRDPRRVRHVTADAEAIRKGVTVRTRQGAWVVARPGHANLIATASGVFVGLSGDYRFLVRIDGGVLVDRKAACTVARWYERAASPDGGAARVVTLNPYGPPDERYVDPSTGAAVTTWQGITVGERPDGSSHTLLQDGVTLDRSPDGDVEVGWPDPPAK